MEAAAFLVDILGLELHKHGKRLPLDITMGIPFLAASCNSVQHLNDGIVCVKSMPLFGPRRCLMSEGRILVKGSSQTTEKCTVTTHSHASEIRS